MSKYFSWANILLVTSEMRERKSNLGEKFCFFMPLCIVGLLQLSALHIEVRHSENKNVT